MQKQAFLLIVPLLAACQTAPAPLTQTLPPPRVVIETITPPPIPTSTAAPTAIPTTEDLIFPYTIEGLRQRDYQSGEIRIRETLGEYESYTAYLIEYPSDGLTITGVMQIPKGEGPFPVILMNHGFYARSIYSSGDGTDRASAYLAQHGYITLASDYRTWGGSDLAGSFFYSGLVVDVINLVQAIPSIPDADPSRVGMWGHSMGGGVTMKVLTILGGRAVPSDSEEHIETTVKAAVLYSTVSADDADIIARWGMGCFGDIAQGEQVIGCNSADVIPSDLPLDLQTAYHNTASDPEALKKVAALYHLEYVTAPIQIHYGTEDGLIYSGTPPEWSLKLTEALRAAGKEADLYRYEGEGHSFIGQPWFDFMNRALRFFDRHVKNNFSQP